MATPLARTVPERRAPRVEPRSVVLRLGEHESSTTLEVSDDLCEGSRRLSDLEVVLTRTDHGAAATLEVALVSHADAPVFVESLSLGLRWCGHAAASHRFLRHGWQSWSFTGSRDLDDAGEPPFPSGPWLRGMHHCVGAPSGEWDGWHESATFAVIGAGAGEGPACLAGVLETGLAFGVVHLRAAGATPGELERPVDIEVELRVEAPLAPGERRALEAVRVAVGPDPSELLERFAALWGRRGRARTGAPYQVGWCSWYHFFHRVTEDDLLRNLDALAGVRDEIPVAVVQLDDGYQRAIGDWLHTNEQLPGGLARVAGAIRDAGFAAGIWTAPFAASAESELLRAHPEWALGDESGDRGDWLRGTLNPEWSADGWVYALDASQPGLLAHLEETFRALAALGFTYQKLDFLYMAAMQGRASDPSLTRAARLRAGLSAVRRGAGDEAFLLGCGCPLGPAVGVVDGMRIGPDVAPTWGVDQPVVIPGLEPVLPSTASALRSIAARLFMHRRLWLNDPDCLMARRRETALRPEEARSLAAAIAVSGGMMVLSDDLALLDAGERSMVSQVLGNGAEIDRAAVGAARLLDPLAPGTLQRLEARVGADVYRAAINLGDSPSAQAAAPEVDWAGDGVALAEISAPGAGQGGDLLAPHASRATRHAGCRPLAVFSDFDGTFSIRDVGSTIALQHLSEERTSLWGRYVQGEIDAWRYAELLFDGFAFGRERLEAFLRTIDLDPGARKLVDWCAARDVPLRILSDGFDYNIDRLQDIHDLRFAFTANHLRFEGERWRISPAGRNPACDCGTGACKRAVIEAYRASRPGHCIVHIGNGRVSDRCGAEAADLAFAKDTLADDLDDRGVVYTRFETLLDVVAALEAEWGERGKSGERGRGAAYTPPPAGC